MKKTLILFCSLFSLLLAARFRSSNPYQTPPTRIAFGTGGRQTSESPPWPVVVRNRPQLWVWLGNDAPGNPADPHRMPWVYALTKTDPSYRQLLETCPVLGIGDDYEHGINGAVYSREAEGRRPAPDSLGKPVNLPRKGAYAAYVYGKNKRQVKVILLDGRCLGDGWKEGVYAVDPAAEAQWAWLEKELTNSPAAIHLIGFGVRAPSEEAAYQPAFSRRRQRLLNLIGKTRPKGIILLDSDQPAAKMSCVTLPGYAHPVYEVTSGGLTSAGPETRTELNHPSADGWTDPLNFGLLTIDWEAHPLAVELQVRDFRNAVLLGQRAVFEAASTTEE